MSRDTAAQMGSDFEERKRRTALESVALDAAAVWTCLTLAQRTDKAFILTALSQSHTLPAKADFERQFPQAVRFDRDIVLAFCHRPDFAQLYKDRHLFVPGSLTADKQVMLAYCSRVPRSLQECAENLTDDIAVVQAAINLDGLELQYASMRLQECPDIVRAACKSDGRAFEFCPPGPVRDSLTRDREFMLTVLRNKGGAMLRLVPETLRTDRELLLEALAHGMRFRYCPPMYHSDPVFLQDVLSRNSEMYFSMNRKLQMVPEIAMAAITAYDSTPAVHVRALEHVPALSNNRSVVLALSKRGDEAFLKKFFTEADPFFKDDKEIMLTAVSRDPKLFLNASARLRADPDLLVAAIDGSTAVDVLKTVPPEVQTEHPEIASRAIAVAWPRNLRLVQAYVTEELWQNRNVVIAWIRRGCRVLPAFENLMGDEQVALEIAQHSWREFSKVANTLKRNHAFMIRAVDANGRVLRFATAEIRNDLPTVVRALASHAEALAAGMSVTRQTVLQYVKDKLDLHTTFVDEFLRGIAVPTPHISPSRRSQLPMLDRGVETSQAFKQLIAAFLGVPVGEELRIVRTCHKHLLNPPMRMPTDRTEIMERRIRYRWAHRQMLRNDGNNDAVPVGPGGAVPEGIVGFFGAAGDDADEDLMVLNRVFVQNEMADRAAIVFRGYGEVDGDVDGDVDVAGREGPNPGILDMMMDPDEDLWDDTDGL